jgi:L-lysine exporter family protein LysE/ArgO
MFAVAFHAFLLQLGLISAIGAQNAFVLRQGVRGEHIGPICLLCAVSDAVLIAAGVAGFGAMVAAAPWLGRAMRLGGAAFLICYGLKSLKSAFGAPAGLTAASGKSGSLQAALLAALAFTWLNPHVYLDTLVLLGSVATHYPGRGVAFAAGAISASFVFFFLLGYGAKRLGPLLASPRAWRVLDVAIAATMGAIAAGLLTGN